MTDSGAIANSIAPLKSIGAGGQLGTHLADLWLVLSRSLETQLGDPELPGTQPLAGGQRIGLPKVEPSCIAEQVQQPFRALFENSRI